MRSGDLDVLRQLEPGAPIDAAGRWVCRGPVHFGTVSLVLRAEAHGSGEAVALRLFRPELFEREQDETLLRDALDRTSRTGGFTAELIEHGRLAVRVDALVAELPFAAFEWIEGPGLREEIRAGVLPDRAFRDALQATRAIGELHRAGLVHGDVRPESFIVGKGAALRAIDLAVPPALRARAEAILGDAWSASRYTPPELLEQGPEALSPASDVYQLGLLAYELFTGAPVSPWVSYEELCEILDFVPPELDAVILSALGRPETRPEDATHFFARLREAEYAYRVNQRNLKPRTERRGRDLFAQAAELSSREAPPWGWIAALCQRALEEKPGLLAFAKKLPTRSIQELLDHSRTELAAARRRHLDWLLSRQSWAAAEAFLDQLADAAPSAELQSLRFQLEVTRLANRRHDAAGRTDACRRLTELLREPEVPHEQRTLAARLLEELMVAVPEGPQPHSIPVVTELGALDPSERWIVQVGEEASVLRIVVGPAMRLGRGSHDEFGNHVDLRPTRREAADDSAILTLAQSISRAGHLELRVGADGLEAFCMGTHGATVDGAALRRGERAALGEDGECMLAQGACRFTYRSIGPADAPIAVELRFLAGVGAGRRAVWVLSRLPGETLAPALADCLDVSPTPEGWRLVAHVEGFSLGGRDLPAGVEMPWPEELPLALGSDLVIHRG